MRKMRGIVASVTALAGLFVCAPNVRGEVVEQIDRRFQGETEAVPNFRQHIIPLVGKMGCNGRACHGSFQGQGGLRLSLFGYDLKADHAALIGKEDAPRISKDDAGGSLVLEKPTLSVPHRGGRRMDVGSWKYNAMLRWIESGTPMNEESASLELKLEITPKEIVFNKAGESAPLKVVAKWSNGQVEDVTPLCRFVTNDEQVAKIDDAGVVSTNEPGDTHIVVFYDNAVMPIPVMRAVSTLAGKKYPKVPTPTKVDELVVNKLRKMGIVPADLCSDTEFLRRVSLDTTGTLPIVSEVEAFLADKSSDKRAKKIEELLERPTYAAWQTTRLCDYTGNNDGFLNQAAGNGLRANPAQDWYDWMYKRVVENTPYDKIVEGILVARSRRDGESYEDFCKRMSDYIRDSKGYADTEGLTYFWARTNVRKPEEKALSVAYSFMGIRIQCAECHKHPFDQWTQDDFKQFREFFTRVNYGNGRGNDGYRALLAKLGLDKKSNTDLRNSLSDLLKKGETIPFPELVLDAARGNTNTGNNKNRTKGTTPARIAKLLGDKEVKIDEIADPRQAVMEWLREKDNRFFARAFVNRVWANYFNVGIVNPPDDLSLANPPSNAELLDYLAKGFVESGYDMKWVHRTICASRAYQASWQTNDTNRLDFRNFSHSIPRRLPAEVAVDAIKVATTSDKDLESVTTDLRRRAIATPGTGGRGGQNQSFALTVFGKSTRESNCDCDRSTDASLLQIIYTHNDNDVYDMIERRGNWVDSLVQAKKSKSSEVMEKGRMIEVAYLRTLSRFPREEEKKRALEFLDSESDPVDAMKGLVWALINTKEFITNH